jgi:predicted GTPase
VDARPGTTRDPVDSRLEFEGNTFLVVDTAGIRNRTRVDGAIEGASVMRAIRSLERAQIVIVVVDASGGVSEQDARLLGLAWLVTTVLVHARTDASGDDDAVEVGRGEPDPDVDVLAHGGHARA